MTESLPAIRLLVGTAWRVDRRLTLAVAAEPVGNAVGLLAGLWLALVTTGVLTRDTTQIIVGVAGLVLGAGLSWQLDLSSSQWRMTLSEKVGHAFDVEIARITASLPGLEHHERGDYQDKLELLRRGQGQLGSSMTTLAVAFKAVCGGLTVFLLLVVVHPLTLGLVALALPAVWIARLQQRWRGGAEVRSATAGRLARHLRAKAHDRDAGMEIRVFGLAGEIQRRASRAWTEHRRVLELTERRIELTGLGQQVLYVLGVVGAVGFVLVRALRGESPPGDVVLVIYLSQQVQTAVSWPIQSMHGLGRTLRTTGRFLWLRDHAALAVPRPGGLPAPARLHTGIVFDRVSFRYPGSDNWVLRDVSLTIPAGTVIAIVGDNGTGKTTLVKLLTRMYEPTSGRVLIDGADLAELDVVAWRERLSAAFQDFARLEFTVQHSVGAGRLSRLDDQAAVLEALDRAGGRDVLSHLSAGTATQLGVRWDGADLSTGQWQKLALGRAMMRTEPLVVFFDEPTASLDASTEHALFDRYATAARAGAARGLVTILVSHRFSTVGSADLIVVLDGQRVAEYGTHDELMRTGGRYAELYTMQARSYQ
ncbi:ABC transporter ATP-binding protein [Nonomuraea sp. NPDC059023]|uniref:ABC transporter ATP-binding protein n=1 Tax=Nonomuraea sp. NPDC059023 TaxID=3346706 RepID=UPI0036AFDA01